MGGSGSQRARIMRNYGSLATIAFLVIGLVFHGWAWAWIVFLLPPVIANVMAGRDDAPAAQVPPPAPPSAALPPPLDPLATDRPGHAGAEPPKDLPPQRYEG